MTGTGTTSSPEALVLYAEHSGAALLTLNRPAALNDFTREMHHALWAALDRAEANPAIRAAVLTGGGWGGYVVGVGM